MKIRAELTINGETRKPFLVSGPSEPDDHLAHRIAAYILFWNDDPTLDATTKTPALANFEFLPDLDTYYAKWLGRPLSDPQEFADKTLDVVRAWSAK